jgi:2-oxoglutarate ferredoxin oxidoreductase subunit alpha
MHAFNLAEQYRCPVFIASNKEIAMTRESVDMDGLTVPAPLQRKQCPTDHSGHPFEPLPGELVPPFLPMGGGESRLSRQTSSTHGPEGYITTDPAIIEQGILRLKEKLHSTVDDFTFFELDAQPDEDDDATLLIVYGVTSRAAKTAVYELRQMGCKISLLILKTLYPVPQALIRKAIDGKKEIVVVEMNNGQYVREIERLAGSVPVRFYGQMNGELISPERIVKEVTA